MNNRILSVPLTPAALVQIETALRLRAASLHGMADDAPSSYARKHYREAGDSYSRLAREIADELVKAGES